LEADVLLVPVGDGAGVALYAVPAAEMARTPVVSLDMTRQLADLTFDTASGEPLLTDAAPAIGRALLTGAALLASEQAGLAQWCLHATVAYLKERKQFGR